GAVGLSPEDIAEKKGLGYTPSAEQALAELGDGRYDAAFFLRPTPVEQVRAVAAAGETMPPKSTYFFPKLLTGIVFNPLSRAPYIVASVVKIYTRKGDDGTTSLWYGGRVAKTDARTQAYGSVDEA